MQVSEWPPFWKELLLILFKRMYCSLCTMSIFKFGCFQFWFRWQDCVSDTPLVPGHGLPFILLSCSESYGTLRTSACEFVMFHIHLDLGFTEKTRKAFTIAQDTVIN